MLTKANVVVSIAIILIIAILGAGCIDSGENEYKDQVRPEEITGSMDSLETLLNSRESYHSGWEGEAPQEWRSYVLMAADSAPVTGSYRDIYVTLPDGKYLYNADTGALTYKEDGDSGDAAFFFSYDRELDFDAGTSYMFAILASVSLWDEPEPQLSSIPMQENLYFGMIEVEELTSELAATSSDGSLPNPKTTGNSSFEEIMDDIRYTSEFSQENIMLSDLSQILWAGYGCTPHTTYNKRAGLTVPSWRAEYFLTENIYVVNQEGVYKYHNRKPSGDMDTRDHRIEQIQTEDIRKELRESITGLPDAPCYIILCLDEEDMEKWYARLETGFVGGNMLLQASALDMGCYFNTQLTNTQQNNVQKITGIGDSDTPHAIVSIGYTEVKDQQALDG